MKNFNVYHLNESNSTDGSWWKERLADNFARDYLKIQRELQRDELRWRTASQVERQLLVLNDLEQWDDEIGDLAGNIGDKIRRGDNPRLDYTISDDVLGFIEMYKVSYSQAAKI